MSTSAVLEPYQALLQHLRTVQALAQQAAWDECFEHMASYEALSLAVRQLDLVAGCFDAAELARYVTEICHYKLTSSSVCGLGRLIPNKL